MLVMTFLFRVVIRCFKALFKTLCRVQMLRCTTNDAFTLSFAALLDQNRVKVTKFN